MGTAMSSDVISLLQRLIQNECVNTGSIDSGHEHRSVATLQEFFGEKGEVFEPTPGRQSVVYKVPGTDPDAPSLALVPHLDVVPVEPDGWVHDPFGGEMVDGFIYGRGAVDMLNITAAFAIAARPYVRGDLAPRGDLIFVAVADEEAGGIQGAYQLVKNRWDLVGADYLLTEVAYPQVSSGSGEPIPVAVAEKGSHFSRLTTTGVPGHGSAPYGADNALEKLIQALDALSRSTSPVSVGEVWSEFVGEIGLDPGLVEALLTPAAVDEAIESIAVDDPLFARYVHAATHLTISPNAAVGGSKVNVIADKAKAILDIRSPFGMDREFVDAHLYEAMGTAGDTVRIKSLGNNDATTSPANGVLWEAIAYGVSEMEGHRNLVPTLMTVATDARFWRRRGTTAYGVGLYDDQTNFSEMLALFHGHNERVSIESVERTADLYERVLRAFLQPT
jgi:acetylornithine deacetylase/succinyl-diaminopimelate desuccinylase-like protein